MKVSPVGAHPGELSQESRGTCGSGAAGALAVKSEPAQLLCEVAAAAPSRPSSLRCFSTSLS